MCQCSITTFTKSFHESFIKADTTPVLALVSAPIHAVISLVEIITGLALSVILAPFALICSKCCPDTDLCKWVVDCWAINAIEHTMIGAIGLAMALNSFITLGLFDVNSQKTSEF